MTRPRADRRMLIPACFVAIFASASAGSILALLFLGGGPIETHVMILFVAFFAGLVLAVVHLLLIALPLYLLLSLRGPVSLPATAAAGFLIGALPLHLLDRGLVWPNPLQFAMYGLSGLSGGLAFWWAMNRAL